jgi:hypothetical protein
MKQKIYIFGLVTAMIVTLGALFKVNHWPGAGILLIAGISVLVFLFMPLALFSSFKTEDNKNKRILYIITWLTICVVFLGMLFKVQSWQGAGYLMLISIPFPFLVFLPVFLFFTSKHQGHDIFKTVYMLFLLMILSCFTALLGIGVSKEKLSESFSVVHIYHLSHKAYDNIPIQKESALSNKIDEVLNISEEYRNLYLGYLKIPADMWKGDLEVFRTSWSFQKPSGKVKRQEEAIHAKLLSELKNLISLMETTPGCESLAAAAPSVFSLRKTPSGNYNWDSDLILAPVHPWLLAYLEGLESNLKMIKITLK